MVSNNILLYGGLGLALFIALGSIRNNGVNAVSQNESSLEGAVSEKTAIDNIITQENSIIANIQKMLKQVTPINRNKRLGSSNITGKNAKFVNSRLVLDRTTSKFLRGLVTAPSASGAKVLAQIEKETAQRSFIDNINSQIDLFRTNPVSL